MEIISVILDVVVWIFTGSSKSDRPNSIGQRVTLVLVIIVVLSLLFWGLSRL